MSGVRTEPKTFHLSLRQAANGGPVADTVADPDGLRGDTERRHIVMLVHGFNNSREFAEQRYALIKKNLLPYLRDAHERPFAIAEFQWPGDEVMSPLPTAAGYPIDISRAKVAAERLAAFLMLLTSPPSLRVTFIGHSLGCRLVLESLARLQGANAPPDIRIVGLMAPAGPVEKVRRSGPLFRTGNPPRQVLKFYSNRDDVLLLAFPSGQFLAYQWGIEDDNYARAVGRNGDPDEYGAAFPTQNGHGTYWEDPAVANTMIGQIDPTMRQLLQPAAIVARKTPTRESLTRNLPSRSLPFDDP
jgi:esterase/lipase superfamily enzyme